MGVDKATLPIAGTSLLDLMHKKLQHAGFEKVVICRNAPNCLSDEIPDKGPIGALYTLSRHYPEQQALIIPVDMPLLHATSLQKLGKASDARQSPSTPVPMTFAGQIFPLLLPFTPCVIRALDTQIKQANDLSIAAFLRTTNAEHIPAPEDKAQFFNSNTPEQWADILARF